MKQRPWPIVILAALHLIAPLGNFFFNYYYSPNSLWDFLKLFFYYKNLVVTFVILILPMLAGLAIYACKKWSYIVYVLIMLTMFGFSTFSWLTMSNPMSLGLYILITVLNIGIVSYFLIPAVRDVYFDPRLRWWEAKPRYKFDQTAKAIINNLSFEGQIKNISEGGLFLKLESTPNDGDEIKIEFESRGQSITVSGLVIVHEKIKELGFAVKFNHTSESLTQIKKLIKALDQEGLLLENRLPGPEDSFQFWMKKITKDKSALIPTIQNKKT